MYRSTIFDSFFSPPVVLVVSEERLQAAERKAKQEQIEAVDVRIEELNKYRLTLAAEIKKLEPAQEVNDNG